MRTGRMGITNVSLGSIALILVALFLICCGENIQTVIPGSPIPPPKSLQALSLNDSSVQLQWSGPGASLDTLLRRYVIRWPGREDSVSTSVLVYVAKPLRPAETLFQVLARSKGGDLSDGVSIRWAPAARYDSAIVLTEYFLQDPTRQAGLHVGTQTTPPRGLVVDPIPSPSVDLLLYGGRGQLADPLSLWSADRFSTGADSVRFSTTTHSSQSLDFPLTSFPDASTFTRDSVAVADNTIYYVRVNGTGQPNYYARIHVHLQLGVFFPNRSVEIRISLQRTPNLPYASRIEDCGRRGFDVRAVGNDLFSLRTCLN
jgi:hypothetical protein